MKRRAVYIVEVLKIIISCITIPLYFIKFFCDAAAYPGINENGEQVIVRVYYYYSILDKISREDMAFLVWGAIATILLSITLSILSMIFKDKKTLRIAGHIVFGVAIVLFFVLLFIAYFIRYHY